MSSGEDLDDSELKIDEGSKIEEPEEAPPAGMMFILRARTAPDWSDRPGVPDVPEVLVFGFKVFGAQFFFQISTFLKLPVIKFRQMPPRNVSPLAIGR